MDMLNALKLALKLVVNEYYINFKELNTGDESGELHGSIHVKFYLQTHLITHH